MSRLHSMWTRVQSGADRENLTLKHLARSRKMKTANWTSWAAAGYAFLVTYIPGTFFFGMIWHELGHGLACLVFGLPFQISLTHVTTPTYPRPWVKIVVGLAGGLGEALSALIVFGCTVWLERLIPDQSLLKRSMFFGFELAFLTISFQGLVAAILEGCFNETYKQLLNNLPFWVTVCISCGILAFYILYRRSARRY